VLKRAVSAFRDHGISAEEERHWMWPATQAARDVWDHESWDALSARQVELARDSGALAALPVALNTRAGMHVLAGEFTEAAALAAEAESVTEATGSGITPYGGLGLVVFQGREAESFALIEATTNDVRRRGEGGGLTFVRWATAVLCNGLGRYEQALAAAQQASQDSPALWFGIWALVELIEAATRSAAPQRAADALRLLSQTTRASGTDWALGVEARSRALVSGGENAEACYREAIDCLGRTRLRVDLGRAHLLYGEWLRRQQRRRDARDQLDRAHDIFDSAGAAAFAQRARIELRASGGHARNRTAGTHDALTAQEALIARLAGAGATNPQVAAKLFISPATVAYHLRKVFTKLGISSRSELAGVLPAQPDTAPPGAE
jgi:DNA-binding CsgD family transcriptional regulator